VQRNTDQLADRLPLSSLGERGGERCGPENNKAAGKTDGQAGR